MATQLKLKIREIPQRSGAVTIPLSLLGDIFDDKESGKDLLWAKMRPLAPEPITVHDKQHLLAIIDWTPEKGIKYSERAKWHKLIERVNDLDEEKEGNFTISDFQKDLIWNRLRRDDFVVRPNPAFDAFVMDFQAATGLHFEQEEPDEPEKEA